MAQTVKNPPANAEDPGSIPGSEDSLEKEMGDPLEKGRAWLPTPVFLPGESHGQRSLVGYSPRGGKELDTTEVTEYSTMVLIKCKSISCL